MSLTDNIKIVDGIKENGEYVATLTDEERTYIAKSILRIPLHMDVNEEARLLHRIIEVLGYPEVYPRGFGSAENTVRKCEKVPD